MNVNERVELYFENESKLGQRRTRGVYLATNSEERGRSYTDQLERPTSKMRLHNSRHRGDRPKLQLALRRVPRRLEVRYLPYGSGTTSVSLLNVAKLVRRPWANE